jgi:hypothetical protein
MFFSSLAYLINLRQTSRHDAAGHQGCKVQKIKKVKFGHNQYEKSQFLKNLKMSKILQKFVYN